MNIKEFEEKYGEEFAYPEDEEAAAEELAKNEAAADLQNTMYDEGYGHFKEGLYRYYAQWASPIRIKIEKIIIIHVSGGQICLMRSSWGPDLSFETLKSKFDCITKKNIF